MSLGLQEASLTLPILEWCLWPSRRSLPLLASLVPALLPRALGEPYTACEPGLCETEEMPAS